MQTWGRVYVGERGRQRERELVLPGDLKVPMFPHFWELVIYSCWSHIKQDQRLLPDIFWTYWGNSNDYQCILPTNDDTGTILREREHKMNTELRQAAHKGRQLNGFHNYSYCCPFFFSSSEQSPGLVIGAQCTEQKSQWFPALNSSPYVLLVQPVTPCISELKAALLPRA